MILLKSLWDKLIQMLFPRRCPICGEIPSSTDTAQLCADCKTVFEADLLIRCTDCRLPASDCICTPKRLRHLVSNVDGRGFLTTAFYQPGDKSSYVNKMIYALKSDTEDTAACIFAQMMSHEIMLRFTKSGKNIRDWLITYPPCRIEKLDDLGFDQARRLAQMCAKYTGARFASLFTRCGGAEQKYLTGAERTENMRNVFRLKKPDTVRGCRIILCDDVLTTGATLAACASLLKEAGASEIVIATAAKTLRREKTEPIQSDMTWFTNS